MMLVISSAAPRPETLDISSYNLFDSVLARSFICNSNGFRMSLFYKPSEELSGEPRCVR